MNESILADFDFSLLDSPDFKEDSVREELILPILKELGYSTKGENKIIRSKAVTHPFIKVGSKKRELKNYPDYLLEVAGKYAWVLDAKAPDEEIKTGENVEQAYFYAIHQEIRVNHFALCNGKEFILFHISQGEALLYFHLTEIEKHWAKLKELLAPAAFAEQQKTVELASVQNKTQFDYLGRKPLAEIRSVKKQSAKRHFGVHGYFTRQAFQILQAYISNFTNTDDVILDPYGGSGVTLVEALMLGGKAIHIDLNPLSVFIVNNLIQPVNFNELIQAFEKVKKEFVENAPRTEEEIKVALEMYPHPRNILLMKNADVDSIEKLFSPLQLAQLAYLKHLIEKNQKATIKNQLLLSFSSTITKINLTYHPSSSRGDKAGDSAAFRYYRFRIAAEQVTLDVFQTFAHKVKKLIAAKKEIANVIDEKTFKNAQVYKGTATNLDKIANESVDYIYTDPPYGAKISYLDLSLMWNV